MKDTEDLLLPEAPTGWIAQENPALSQGAEAHSKKPVLVGAGLRRKPACSYLTRPTTHQGFEKCTNRIATAQTPRDLAVRAWQGTWRWSSSARCSGRAWRP